MEPITYPKNEIVWVEFRGTKPIYIITSKPDRSMYYLYTPNPDGTWSRWGKDASAGELERRFRKERGWK